jgi:DNA mismatch repair protein MutL
MSIRILPSDVVHRIAAGEVIDRPYAVVKELMENSIDAHATFIQVAIRNGGKTYISVRDNGWGIKKDELELAIQRHTTSKLPKDDLSDVRTLGFRGEGLPSIAAGSRLHISSRTPDEDTGWSLFAEGGKVHPLKPVPQDMGTHVEVKDLFYALPSRLRFLKTDAWESEFILVTFKKLALAYPSIRFTLKVDKHEIFDLPCSSDKKRLINIFGKDFAKNHIPLNGGQGVLKLKGAISLPTFHKSTPNYQYFFVNGRPVKDRLLSSTVRNAYQDLVFRKRYPVLALFIEVPPDEIDINIHPQKHEIRFKQPEIIRRFIKGALSHALHENAHQVSTTLSREMLDILFTDESSSPHSYDTLKEEFSPYTSPKEQKKFQHEQSFRSYPLGHAQGQLYETYIFSEGEDQVFIIDQHAMHERLVYEQMKHSIQKRGLQVRALIPPPKFKPNQLESELMSTYQAELKSFGFIVKKKAEWVIIHGVPELLGEVDAKQLLHDVLDEIKDFDHHTQLKVRIDRICSLLSCHVSIRGGQCLNIDEMNHLLRQAERTYHSGQCNHGRPTYVTIKKQDLDKLFKRK